MKPDLVIGLGNAVMGDDGVGCIVADRLARDPRLPATTEVLHGGADLLRFSDEMEFRRRVIIVDAIIDDAPPGTVVIGRDELLNVAPHHRHAHHLSAPGLIGALREVSPPHAQVQFVLFGIAIESARAGAGLSAALEDKLGVIGAELLNELEY